MLRVLKSIFSTGAGSITSLLLSVTIANLSDTAALGQFGVTYAVFLILQLFARDASVTPLLGEEPDVDTIRQQCGRQSLIGVVSAGALFIIGLVLQLPLILILAGGIHGLLVLNYSKLLNLTIGNGKAAISQDLVVLLAVTVVSIASLAMRWDYHWVVLTWSMVSAFTGYVFALLQRFQLRPKWQGRGEESRVGIVFAIQSLISSGAVHILTILLSVTTSATLVGAIRGATTLLGPANLMPNALTPLITRHLSQVRAAPRRARLTTLARLALGLTTAYVAIAATTVAASYHFGELILGDVWADVKPVIMVMAIDGALYALATVPMAVHRSMWASTRGIGISSALLTIRFPMVLVGAIYGGATGAAVGFAVSTGISTIIWWLSAMQLPPRDDPNKNR